MKSFEIKNALNLFDLECFMSGRAISNPFGHGGVVKAGEENDESVNERMNDGRVCRAAPGFVEVC